jgi:hypothetical protein
MDWKTVISVLIGGVLSLLASWFVAGKYFNKQRRIDKAREEVDVHLSYGLLMNSFFAALGKRPKGSATRIAMSEFEAKLKVYDRVFDASQIQREAVEQADKMIHDHPDDFEDIPK